MELMDKIDCGIEGFNNLLYGGLPPGRAYLISGEPGTGKTTFTLQYLLTGLQKGENGLFISIDEKPEHIIADAKTIGWDLTPYLENGSFQIIDVTNYFKNKKDNEEINIDTEKITSDIIDHIQKNNIKRLAIDPISPLTFASERSHTIINYIRSLIFKIENNTGCTSLLTSYVPVGSNKLSTLGIEEFATSGIIVLKLAKIDNKRVRTIGIHKMRGSQIDLTEYSFDILTNRGIVLRQPI